MYRFFFFPSLIISCEIKLIKVTCRIEDKSAKGWKSEPELSVVLLVPHRPVN